MNSSATSVSGPIRGANDASYQSRPRAFTGVNRVMADRFESVTGKPYRGVEDFGDYPEGSSNWMVWRFMELGRQYLDAGHPDEAANVFRSAARQFPDDPLIRQRGEQMERSR